MSSVERKGSNLSRRRYITRGEAVDIPAYGGPEDECAPGDILPVDKSIGSPPPTPPSRRQPPQTPPSGRARRRYERSPGSLSPSTASSRRRISPLGSPSTQSRRAHTLGTPAQHPVGGDMSRYGSFGKDAAPSGGGSSLGRSLTVDGGVGYKHYPSYLGSRLAELDPTRTSSHRVGRRDSSSSESSIHGSAASLHSDGSIRDSTPGYHDNLMTPPRSPIDKQTPSRPLSGRPRSWCDPQQLQGHSHLSSESPTGFPFAASSYENLDKEGSSEKSLPRSSTLGSFGAQKKDNLSRLAHAQSFAGHEGRDSLSPRPSSGSSPFVVAKHFPGGKSSSWQPNPSSKSSEFGATRSKFTSDSNVRKFFPESGTLPGTRESPYSRMGSGESDGSSVASAASMPTFGTTRSLASESQEVALVSRQPVRDRFSRDRSFDSSISEPITLKSQSAFGPNGEVVYTQHAPRKARPFGNRSQTVELSQIQNTAYGSTSPRNVTAIPENKPWKRSTATSSSVKEQAKMFDKKKDLVVPPGGVPILPPGGGQSKDVSHYPVGDYKSATMPAKLYDSYDPDRRPSLPEQADKNVLYKEQRLKELSAFPTHSNVPKRSQSFDTHMGKKSPLFRTEAPSISKEDMLMATVAGRTKGVMSPHSAVMSPHSAVMSSISAVMSTHSTVMSPHSAVMSPHSAGMSLHSAVMSSHSAVMSPMSAVKSPHSAVMSSIPAVISSESARVSKAMPSTVTQSVLGVHKPSFMPIVSKSSPFVSNEQKSPPLEIMENINPLDTAKSKSTSPGTSPVKPLASPPLVVKTTDVVSTVDITAPRTITTNSTKSAFKPFVKINDTTPASVIQKPVAMEPVIADKNLITVVKDEIPVTMVTAGNDGMTVDMVQIATDDQPISIATVVKDESIVAMAAVAKDERLVAMATVANDERLVTSVSISLGDPPVTSSSVICVTSSAPSDVLSSITETSLITTAKSPLLSPKSSLPSSHSSLSPSSRGSCSTSPHLSPRPLELWSTKQKDLRHEYYDREEEKDKPDLKRGISQESIQSAMAVLDDAIAMLNSVAMDKGTGNLVTMVTAAPITTTTTGVDAPTIDLSHSGLMKYSPKNRPAKTVVTSRFASMPITTMSTATGSLSSIGSLSDIVAPSQSTVPRSQPLKEVTQLVSSVKTAVCSDQSKSALLTSSHPIIENSSLDSTQTGGSTGQGTNHHNSISSNNHSNTDHSNHVQISGSHSNHTSALSNNHTLTMDEKNNHVLHVDNHGNHTLAAGNHCNDMLHLNNHDNQVTCAGIQVADTSPLDQILAAMCEEECKPISDITNKQAMTTGGALYGDKMRKPEKPKKKKILDKDKSLDEIEARRRTLIQDDSFNRSDSEPDIESMALPRDSVILRHRYHIKDEMSTSSDSSSPATPRLSPRAIRRHRKTGSDSSTIGDSKKRKHLGIPGKHKPGKDLSGSDRQITTPDGHTISPYPDPGAPYGQTRELSPSTGTYYSVPSSGSPLVAPSSEMTWSTPPSTPQLPPLAMDIPQGQGQGSEAPRSRGFDLTNQEEGVYNVHTAAMVRPGSAGLPSDSSSMSSRRRRFRVRDQEKIEENVSSVTVRPGKKDKSQQRKSMLNHPGPDGLDHRAHPSDLSSSSSEAQRRRSSTPQSLGNQPPSLGSQPPSLGSQYGSVAPTTSPTGRFLSGKGPKKDGKPSALGTLISQTAMFATGLARPKVGDNRGPHEVLPPSAESDTLSIHSKEGESAHIPEPQTPPPMDPTTKVKAVTPIFAPHHQLPGSLPYGKSSLSSYPSPQDYRLASPHKGRSFSPPAGHPVSGKMSPPPGVPMMGSQMIRKQPFSLQGGAVGSQQPSLIRTSGSLSSIPAATRALSQVSSESALPQLRVAAVTQPGSRAASTPSTVAMRSTHSVVTMATAAESRTSGIPASITKDSLPNKPIASPKLVKTTRLKPLSDTMPGVKSLPGKGQQGQRLTQQPVSSGGLVYQGTRQELQQTRFSHPQEKQEQKEQQKKQEQKDGQKQKDVPLISHQQHQGVETVRLNKQQESALKAEQPAKHKQVPSQQQHSQVETVDISKQLGTTPGGVEQQAKQQQTKQQEKQHLPDKTKVKEDLIKDKVKDEGQEKVKGEVPKLGTSQKQVKSTETVSKPEKQVIKSTSDKQSTNNKQPTNDKPSTNDKPASLQQKEAPSTKLQSITKPLTQQKVPQPQHKAPQLPSKQKPALGRSSVLKQKAVVSEVKPYPVAKAASPPLVKAKSKPNSEPESPRPIAKPPQKESASKSEPSAVVQKKEPLVSKELQAQVIKKADGKSEASIKKGLVIPGDKKGKITQKSPGDETQGRDDSAGKEFIKKDIVHEMPCVDKTTFKKILPKEAQSLAQMEPLYSAELKRSASVPTQKRGILRAQVSNPEIKETKLIATVKDNVQSTEEQIKVRDDDSQSERELEFMTPPTTPSTSQTDLTERKAELIKPKTDDQSGSASIRPGKETNCENKYVENEQMKTSTDHKVTFVDDEESGDKKDAAVDEPTDGDETIIASDAPVLDKIVAWQKHLTQPSMTQSLRQSILRDRRGHGVWSSGDSVPEQVSMLTPITEEQKSDKSDSRTEVSGGSGEEERDKVSVAQRIVQMENKSEEDRFTLSRPTSGYTTPRLKVLRPLGSPLKGSFTPHVRALEPTSPLETDERRLLDKLTQVADIAMVRDAAAERRKRFMQRRSDDRRRTQPVTLDEIREADSLESVNTFRAEVLRKSSLNIFEQEETNQEPSLSIKKSKGQEIFPQHIKHERLKERRNGTRYKTLPVTQTELNQIPEAETLTILQKSSSVKTLRQRLEEMERMDSNEDVQDGKSDVTRETNIEADKQIKSVKDTAPVLKVTESDTMLPEYLKESLRVSMETKPSETESVSVETTECVSVTKSPIKSPLSSSAQQIKTGAVTTATTTTATMATTATSSRRISAAKLSMLDVLDDELDQLVEINYKEISSHKRKQKQTSTGSMKSDKVSQRHPANQHQDQSIVLTSQPQAKQTEITKLMTPSTSDMSKVQTTITTSKAQTPSSATKTESVTPAVKAQTAMATSKAQTAAVSTVAASKVQSVMSTARTQSATATPKVQSVMSTARTQSATATPKVQSAMSKSKYQLVTAPPKVQSGLKTVVSPTPSVETGGDVQTAKTGQKSSEILRGTPRQSEISKSTSPAQAQAPQTSTGKKETEKNIERKVQKTVAKKEILKTGLNVQKQSETGKVISPTGAQPEPTKITSTEQQQPEKLLFSAKQPAEKKSVPNVSVKQPTVTKEPSEPSTEVEDKSDKIQPVKTTVPKTPANVQTKEQIVVSTTQRQLESDKVKTSKTGVESTTIASESRKEPEKQKFPPLPKVVNTESLSKTAKVSSTLVTDVKHTVKVSAYQKSDKDDKSSISANHKPVQGKSTSSANQQVELSANQKVELSVNQNVESSANLKVESTTNQKVELSANQPTDDKSGLVAPSEEKTAGILSQIVPPLVEMESSPSMDQDVSTTDTEGPEDELSKMSVSDKLKLFKKLDKTAQLDQEAKQRRRFADRKKRFVRSHTLPVTEDEVSDVHDKKEGKDGMSKSATSLEHLEGDKTVSDKTTIPEAGQGVRRGSDLTRLIQGDLGVTETEKQDKEAADVGAEDKLEAEMGEDEVKEEDSLSKMSLAEKVHLFSKRKEESPQKRETAVMRRKNRRLQSRFKTQSADEPITIEEVEKARISPLAMSLIKPPDAEILQALPIRDQREMMAQWAESALSDIGSRSRSGSRPSSMVLDDVKVTGGSRRTSMDDDSGAEDRKTKGILKAHETHPPEVRSILKQSPPSSDREVRSILKTDGAQSDGESDKKPASILKHETSHQEMDSGDHHSILKREAVHLETRPESHSILKKDSIQLKKDASLISAATESTHSILKKEGPPHELKHEIRGILKKESSFESKMEAEKRLLRRSDGNEEDRLVLDVEVGKDKIDLNANSQTVDSESVIKQTQAPVKDQSKLKKTSSFEMHVEHPVKSVKKDEHEIKTLVKSDHTSLSSKVSIDKSQTETSEALQTKSVTKVTEPVVTKDTSSEDTIKNVVLPPGGRSRLKSDDDVTRTPVSADLSPRPVSNLSRSRSARVAGRDSSTDDDSSTSSEKMSWIKNDAVARRRFRKMEEKGGSTSQQPSNAESNQELKDGQESRETSSHQPLAKSTSSPEKSTTDVAVDPAVVKLRDNKSDRPRPRSMGITDRLSKLQDAQDSWRDKVEEKDVSKFTIEGKLNMAGLSANPDSSHMTRRLQGTPGKFPLKRESPVTSPRTPNGPQSQARGSFNFRSPRSPQQSTGHESNSSTSPPPQSSPNLIMKLDDSSDEEPVDPQHLSSCVKVSNPNSEEFTDFFSTQSGNEQKVDVSLDDFNHVLIEGSAILHNVKKIRPHHRQKGSRNPVKNLAKREDIKQEYEEVRSGVTEQELSRIKREAIVGKSQMTHDTMAALATKENFSKVQLRKTLGGGTGKQSETVPYKDIMLLQVKGRRHCQTYLVAPRASSINSGDCFLLVTSNALYLWQGEYSNVIERSRAAELASNICQKRDLGCKTSQEPVLITEAKQTISSASQKFWEILGGYEEYQPPGTAEEDELYETYMAESAKIYGMKGEELIMLDSGYPPSYDMLKSKQTLVFDFGSEMYVWTGKQVPFNERKNAVSLARLIWNKGYNYEDANINPLSPLHSEEAGGLPSKSDTRPDWAMFAKVSENMETILFKEKFIDWPDSAKIIMVKGHDSEPTKEEAPELVPYDVAKMLPLDTTPISLLLEGSHVGRGKSWKEFADGLRREYEIITLDIKVFHILEYDHFKIDPVSHGQFHDNDTYVIRWDLMISQTGMKNIHSKDSRTMQTGRKRVVYFFWQGHHSTVSEKGASALTTIELDEERGPQIRVPQGKEPPCFLQLFKNKMIIHIGKREDESTNTTGQWRLYIVRGELLDECYLMEVPCKMSSLRSRSSMILVNVKTGIMQVWHGSKSASHIRQQAVGIGKALEQSCPPEIGLHDNVQIIMCEITEGMEKSDFLVAMDTRERTYHSLMKDPTQQHHSPRLFHMHSVCGEFVATEILCPSRNHDNLCSPFPFSQNELEHASQPALLLLDNHYEVFVWQGWWPDQSEDMENIRTGSAESQLRVNRKLAIETALNYCKEKTPENPPKGWLVYAGLEPVRFTNLFPVWEVNEEAKASNLKEERKDGEMTALDNLLKKLSCTEFTFDDLQVRPLPEGVDPLKIEAYLDDAEFLKIVKRTKKEFYALPVWKQKQIKKDSALF